MSFSFLLIVLPIFLFAVISGTACITGALVTGNIRTLERFLVAFLVTQAVVAIVPLGVLSMVLVTTLRNPNTAIPAGVWIAPAAILGIQGITMLAFYFGYGTKRRRLLHAG